MTQYIFVTGGVVSALGKGLATASLAALLKARGYKVRVRKFDPYLNVDPGTMSPSQHGEVFVTDDGAETDLDLGHYERFADVTCTSDDNLTAGQVYSSVIARERSGDYLGGTVQVVPHITNAIKEALVRGVDADVDFLLCEIGGTVGDIEGSPFLEAVRQFHNEVGHENAMFIHLTLVPYIASAGELKTKPSQHSVKTLQREGIRADMLLCRCDRPLPESSKAKLALFCNIAPENVIEAIDVDNVYKVPLEFARQEMDLRVLSHFGIPNPPEAQMQEWQDMVERVSNAKQSVTIAIVAKYLQLKDSYKSLIEALAHGAGVHQAQMNILWLNPEEFEQGEGEARTPKPISEIEQTLAQADGILVPGGYGVRGTAGKSAAITYAREKNVPFLGICFGMQLAVIEAARNLADIPQANSTEFGLTTEPVVGLLTEWMKGSQLEKRSHESQKGGTMRLGAYDCYLAPNSLARQIYGSDVIQERHRHRYEVNVSYREALEGAGLMITGFDSSGDLPTIVERSDHPWFLAVQFHPEFKSRPCSPSPLFAAFTKAALVYKSRKEKS
ncbi:MAG: CTP synthase [Pseudomonadota bacterium]